MTLNLPPNESAPSVNGGSLSLQSTAPYFGGSFSVVLSSAQGLVSWSGQQVYGQPWDPLLNLYTTSGSPGEAYGYWPVTLSVDAGINVSNLTSLATSTSGAVVSYPSTFSTGGASPQSTGSPTPT